MVYKGRQASGVCAFAVMAILAAVMAEKMLAADGKVLSGLGSPMGLCAEAPALGPGEDARCSRITGSTVYYESAVALSSVFAVGDFSGDGNDDAVLVLNTRVLRSYLNNDGNFNSVVRSTVDGSLPGDGLDVALVRIDADSDRDILLLTDAPSLAWYSNTDGAGTFSSANVIGLGATSGWLRIVAVDVDNDGDTDVVGISNNELRVVINSDGAGSFAAPVQYTLTGAALLSVAAGDVNGDGYADAVLSDGNAGLYWLVNDGSGGFSAGARQVFESQVTAAGAAVVVGDLRGIGLLDVVVRTTDARVVVYYGLGGGSFAPQLTILQGVSSTSRDSIAIASLKDFKYSAVLMHKDAAGIIAVRVYNDAGDMSGPYLMARDVSWSLSAIAVGDRNSDGIADVFAFDTTGSRMVTTVSETKAAVEPEAAQRIVGVLEAASLVMKAFDLDYDGHEEVFLLAEPGFSIVRTQTTFSSTYFSLYLFNEENIVGTDVAFGDVNVDSMPDWVIAVPGENTLVVYLLEATTPAVAFSRRPVTCTMPAVTFVVLADMDADGMLDYVVASSSGTVAWMKVDGATGDCVPDSTTVMGNLGATVASLAVSDLNGDGLPDVAVGLEESVGVLLGMAQGGTAFDVSTYVVSGGASFVRIQTGDMDLDGAVDIVWISSNLLLSSLVNSGDGTFTLRGSPILAFNNVQHNFALHDYNLDGTLDILVSRGIGNVALQLFTNDGVPGTFAHSPNILCTYNLPVYDAIPVSSGYTATDVLVWTGVNVKVGRLSTTSPLALRAPRTHTEAAGDGYFLRTDAKSPCFKFAVAGGRNMACVAQRMARAGRCVRDRVVLEAGRYVYCPTISHIKTSFAVELAAAEPGSVVLDCEGRGVLFASIREDQRREIPGIGIGGLVLTNLTIRGMAISSTISKSAPGLRVVGSEASLQLHGTVIEGCDTTPSISGLVVYDGGGGCVLGLNGGRVLMDNSTISGSTAGDGSGGGGLALVGLDSAGCIRDGSVISGNLARSGPGGGATVRSGATLRVERGAVISGNVAETRGGGLFVDNDAEVVVDGSLEGVRIEGNSAQSGGGGLCVVSASRANVSHVVLAGNVASFGSGGGLQATTGAIVVVDASSVSGNTAERSGGGLLAEAPASVTLTGESSVSSNHAGTFGGGLVAMEGGLEALLAETRTVLSLPEASTAPDESCSPVVVLDGARSYDNVARRGGGNMLLCGGCVAVSGSKAEVRGQILTCLPVGGPDGIAAGGAFVPDRTDANSLPWLAFDAASWANSREGSTFTSPPTRLVWEVEPEASIAAGIRMAGSVSASDWFGGDAGRSDYEVEASLGPGTPAGVVLVGTNVMRMTAGAPTSIPAVSVTVDDSGVLPLDGVSVVVSVRETSAAAVRVVAAVRIESCGPGFGGGAVGGGGFGCFACSGDTFSLVSGVAPCEACPANSAVGGSGSMNGTNSRCSCFPGFYHLEPGTACAACPEGGVCGGGSELPVAAPGFAPGGRVDLFVACPTAEACAGGGACATGYAAQLCAECADGYYALSGKCFKCNTGRNAAAVLLLVLGCLAVICVLLGFNLAESMSYKFASLMIGLNGLQIVALYGRLDFKWGAFAAAYFDIASAVNVNLELTSPECAAADGTDVWVLKFVLTLVMPVFAAAGLGLASGLFAVARAVHAPWVRNKSIGELVGAAKRCMWQIMVLLYMALVSGSFSLFGCRKDATGRWVLDDAPSRSCYTATWWGLFPLGLCGVLGYGLGLPGCVVWVLKQQRDALDEVSFVLRYGFLVGRFSASAWWFEALVMARKASLVMSMTLFWGDMTKAYVSVAVLACFCVDLHVRKPYVNKHHNMVATVVLVAAMGVLHAGTFTNTTLRSIGVVGGIVVMVGGMLAAAGVDVLLARRREKEAAAEFGDGGSSLAFDVERAQARSSVIVEAPGGSDSCGSTAVIGSLGGLGSAAGSAPVNPVLDSVQGSEGGEFSTAAMSSVGTVDGTGTV
ncbi:uncharacterized protein AMSG_00594 [Thecamonas trahens ATCC 50062]|uniref:DUF7630 domain-containing protein n=1 Tax=Thecamonas trahens ATCC 50062 TaxID=461836 RepID=A0A0L0DBX9_THETB|nr:hypothetical protein AMSG_00594 [Thecamonas trahens ATCC 50062]KNC48813.1 hypothetical protein AMSG_00594 [Thecamonas trahens ATCC 50062]|eukprot:XP_013762864.1 hypothetical protein AMSG_00594 [Thecamonas trahens ATCC 50062]